MRIMALGDLHITDSQPKSRKDNYFDTILKKLEWIRQTAEAEKINCIIQPGDLVDSWKESDYLKQHLIKILSVWKKNAKVYTVFGQHDLRYHSANRLNTPTAILHASGNIEILKEKPVYINENDFVPDVYLYGFSWGDTEIPNTVKKLGVHILVLHSMIIESEKLWPGQEDYQSAKLLLKRYNFDYVISGDNHKSFHVKEKDKFLINCGSLMRKNVDQKDHKPCVWIIDTVTRETKQLFIPIEPSENVLTFEKHEEKKEENKNLSALLDSIKKGNVISGLDFKRNLENKTQKTQTEVKQVINNIMEEATNE